MAEMTPALRHCPDPDPARWIVEADVAVDQLVNFGPLGFDAYARLRFIPDPVRPGQQEGDVELTDEHLPDLVQAQLALHRLADFTSTSQDCFFCVWEGYSDVPLPPEVTEASLVVLPHRRYALFRGPLDGIDTFAHDFGSGQPVAPPAFVWPSDRAWCFARDVDPHWAGIGATRAAVEALRAEVPIDVVSANPYERQPLYY